MVDILGAVLTDGLEAVEAACAAALSEGVHSAVEVARVPRLSVGPDLAPGAADDVLGPADWPEAVKGGIARENLESGAMVKEVALRGRSGTGSPRSS